jgi:hypothetical protein
VDGNETGPGQDAATVSVFDRIIERQLDEITTIANEAEDPVTALLTMVHHHLSFALEDRDHLANWRQEFRTLPSEDAWRLRRMQRLYVEEWVQVVGEVRPDLSEAQARAAVHATLALLHSPTEYKSGLPSDALTPLLTSMALGALRGANSESPPSVVTESTL